MRAEDRVVDARLTRGMGVCEMLEAYKGIHGFTASSLWEAVSILKEGLGKSGLRILSFTANLVATGLRGVISQLIGSGLFNVVITTTGSVDHDIARSLGARYLKGSFDVDDEDLADRGLHRLGNIVIPSSDYGPLVEGFTIELAESCSRLKKKWAVYELLREAGSRLEDENSVLRSAYQRRVDVFLPGWPDGAFGTALFTAKEKGVSIEVDYMADMKRLAEHFFTTPGKSAALIIGGGISKHHTIWWAQYRGGLDYAVYLTTAQEYDGSLSGARPREAVTWGKIRRAANKATVYGDATVLLPLIAYGILYC
ncbi:MAG: deoxyhypusine synthase [Desulfurococcales archaeon]|nr:deoxyhypusine synthase [Desulfurococcales archaeon]